MSEIRPWWVNSDPSHPANQMPQEQPVALDDPQPCPPQPDWAQALHDRLCAIEAWIKDRMPGAQAPAPEPMPIDAEQPSVPEQGVG